MRSLLIRFHPRYAMKIRWLFLATIVLTGVVVLQPQPVRAQGETKTWSERLGWPADKRVVIFHADDIGMCYEANQAAQNALTKGEYRSAATMVPCPWFNE